MTKKEKQDKALEGIRNVCVNLLGVEAEDVTLDKIFCNAPQGKDENGKWIDEDHTLNKDFPQGISPSDDAYGNYLGMDAVDSFKFMLYLEQEFNKEIDDTNFVPRSNIDHKLLWRYRKVGDLVDYIAENMID